MMMVTQYLDVLKEFAVSGKATMVVPHGPSAVSDIEAQVHGRAFPLLDANTALVVPHGPPVVYSTRANGRLRHGILGAAMNLCYGDEKTNAIPPPPNF